MQLIALADVTLGFRGPPVLERANLTIEPGERVCLLGRNGTGKTTLLRLIHGELEPDRGEIARQQGLVTAMLPQEVPRDLQRHGLRRGRPRAWARGPNCWPSIITWRTGWPSKASDELHARLDRIQHALEIDGGWRMHQEVEAVISRMSLDAGRRRGRRSRPA